MGRLQSPHGDRIVSVLNVNQPLARSVMSLRVVPFVIGNHYHISDYIAVEFSSFFYTDLIVHEY